MDAATSPSPRKRVIALDTLRGFTIVSMVAFHACYDASYIYGYSLPWFSDALFQGIWRASISWTFLLLAGWMTRLSRSNVKRGLIYTAAALAVFGATALTGVDTAITFGILFCMAASTLMFAALQRCVRDCKHPLFVALLCALLFFLTYGFPQSRYAVGGLAWLGFPSPTFASGDYYPLLPFSLLFFCGAFLSEAFYKRAGRYPAWMMRDWIPPLTMLGRHSLIVYLLHQPVLIVLFEILALF